MKSQWIVNGALLLTLLLSGCTDRDKKGRPVDTPTSGDIKIAVDESLRPLIEAEINAFHAIYKYAHIEATYLSEGEAINAMLKDSARLAIVTRNLTDDEFSVLSKENISPRQIKIATSSVALIINKNNSDSLLRISQLKEILEGKIKDWKQLNPARNSSPIEVVFDNPTSGIVRLLRDSVVDVKTLPPNFYAVKSNQAVVDYVSQKSNVIGIIGVEWISDIDDSTSSNFLNTIRVMAIARDSDYVKPFQAYMALNQYPLCRETLIISREARTGLGSGFIAFVASDKGQRIVLKAGLVPATMPVRIVEINQE